MTFLLLIRVAGPAVSIRIESVMAAFRAIIARWLRGGNDDLVKDLTGSPWGRLARSHDREIGDRMSRRSRGSFTAR
jgi:hypothetical protein